MALLATTWPGVARASYTGGVWSVERNLDRTYVTCLAVAPCDPAEIWAGTKSDGTLRSSDGGATWRSAGLEGTAVRALAVSSREPDVAFAGVKPAGVFVTRDGGNTWRECEGFREVRRWWWWSPAEPPEVAPYVSAIAVSPQDPNVVLAGVEFGAVVRSDDGGRTWSPHRRRADRDCHALCFHHRDGAWAYEAGGGGPAVSRDGGVSFRHPRAGLAGRYAMACAADPHRPEVWYVSASPMAAWPRLWEVPVAHSDGRAHAAIYRSNGGARWERLTGGLPQPLDHMAYGLATDPRAPGHLYAGLANGHVWHSHDYGDTWSRLPVELGAVRRAMVWA